jgi:tripartite-type tricarboxylate transporter receptor subunit TctC
MWRIAAIAPMCATLLVAAELSVAQTYPAKTIRIVVPYPAGGGVDLTGRAIAPQLATALGVSVIVDNRPGAGGRTRAVNRAPACGM